MMCLSLTLAHQKASDSIWLGENKWNTWNRNNLSKCTKSLAFAGLFVL